MNRKNLLAALISGLGIAAASMPASAIVVGGVDFGAGSTSHLDTTTLAETLVLADGDILKGYGQINTINGETNYTTVAGQRLYFVFDGYTAANFSSTSVDFTGGEVRVYLGAAFNTLNQDSATNWSTIESYTPWLTLTGHAMNGTAYTLSAGGVLVGAALSFGGTGLLDVDETGAGMADVIALLNGNSEYDDVLPGGGFADITLNTSGSNNANRLNKNDDLTGCADGTAAAGQWCIAGSADLSGSFNAIPEPGIAALLGIGVFGLGAISRRRKEV